MYGPCVGTYIIEPRRLRVTVSTVPSPPSAIVTSIYSTLPNTRCVACLNKRLILIALIVPLNESGANKNFIYPPAVDIFIMIPINIENNTAKIEASTLIAIGVPLSFDIKNARITPEMTPMTPPVDVNTTASVRN